MASAAEADWRFTDSRWTTVAGSKYRIRRYVETGNPPLQTDISTEEYTYSGSTWMGTWYYNFNYNATIDLLPETAQVYGDVEVDLGGIGSWAPVGTIRPEWEP